MCVYPLVTSIISTLMCKNPSVQFKRWTVSVIHTVFRESLHSTTFTVDPVTFDRRKGQSPRDAQREREREREEEREMRGGERAREIRSRADLLSSALALSLCSSLLSLSPERFGCTTSLARFVPPECFNLHAWLFQFFFPVVWCSGLSLLLINITLVGIWTNHLFYLFHYGM